MTRSGVAHVADALGRELVLTVERLCLHARMLENASRRVARVAELVDPSHEREVGRVVDQIRRSVSDLSSALVSVLEESGRVDALIRSRALLEGASGMGVRG